MDASYHKWCRQDMRKKNAGPIRQRCGVALALADDAADRFNGHVPWLGMCGILVVLGFMLHYL